MQTKSANAASELWAITAYFNPTQSTRRLANYRYFWQNLTVPLLTIEWHPAKHFQLTPEDASHLIQIGGGDWMWQKERLLTIALSALPAQAKYVAWLDCDVLFLNTTWINHAQQLLKHYPIIQPFQEVVYLSESVTQSLQQQACTVNDLDISDLPKRPSFARIFAQLGDDIVNSDLAQRFSLEKNSYDIMARPAYGHAWLARLDFIRQVGFYDRCILGGGDLLLAYGLIGKGLALIENHQSVGWDFYGNCASYRNWSANAFAHCGGQLQSSEDTMLHLFHGELEHRQYKSRIDGLVEFKLAIDNDIIADDLQPWSWRHSHEKLNAYFLRYMQNRKEDI